MPLALTTNHWVFPWDVGKCVCEGGVWEGQAPLVSPLIPQGPQVYTFSIREEIDKGDLSPGCSGEGLQGELLHPVGSSSRRKIFSFPSNSPANERLSPPSQWKAAAL